MEWGTLFCLPQTRKLAPAFSWTPGGLADVNDNNDTMISTSSSDCFVLGCVEVCVIVTTASVLLSTSWSQALGSALRMHDLIVTATCWASAGDVIPIPQLGKGRKWLA